jgi:hypothetical protein
MSASECTVERYEQDRNLLILLLQTNASSEVAVLSSKEMVLLEDSAKIKSPGWSSDHCAKGSGAAVAGDPQTLSVIATYRPKRRILWCPEGL